MNAPLEDPLLHAAGISHGFGLRDSPAPEGLARPRQVHGIAIHEAHAAGYARAVRADAIVSCTPGLPVGVVTADCVPVLLADPAGGFVAAVHAGWRGLTAGVGAATVAWLAGRGVAPEELVAAIGPHVGPCCYEVDAPVLSAVRTRFGDSGLEQATRPGRSAHAWLDLGNLMRRELLRAGLSESAIGSAAAACTACDSSRFHSYRRDGPRAGRMPHWVVAGPPRP
jgi:YfiH family protein